MMAFANKPWRRPEPLVAKASTRRLDDKGPDRNALWLARIRSRPCLLCPHGQQKHPTEAHHPKGLFPRTLGKRISDLLCLPLCQGHHTISPDALHRGGDELAWWRRHGADPYGVILSQLAGYRGPDREEAIAFVKLHRERAAA
jgi:hypothetical protein